MAGVHPQAQATPVPPIRWQCHVCLGGPHLYANTTRCTNVRSNNHPCNHDFCHAHCKKDNDIPPPLTSTRSSPPGLGSGHQAHSTLPPPLTGRFRYLGGYTNVHNHGTSSARQCSRRNSRNHISPEPRQSRDSAIRTTDVLPRSRPSMTGWWECCHCRQLNNPGLRTGRCNLCAHPGPCVCCKVYR